MQYTVYIMYTMYITHVCVYNSVYIILLMNF